MANLSKSIDTRKRVSEILSAGEICEKDLNLLKSRINRGLCKYEDIEPLFLDCVTLSDDQTAKGVNRGKLQHCKARRQFRELREDTDLACNVTEKYFDGEEEFYKDVINFGDWWRYFDAVNAYFQN